MLASGDVRDGADDPRRGAFGVVRDFSAGREPAHRAVLEERAVFGGEGAPVLERPAQGMNHGLEVLGVDGREPVVAGERQPQGLDPDELEEERRRLERRRLELELEDAEAAHVLDEAQELGGAPEFRLAALAAADELVQRLRQGIELIAAGIGGRLGVRERRELEPQRSDTRGEAVRHREREGRGHDEHIGGEKPPREAMLGACRREPRGRADDDCSRHREGEQLGANRPTAHASTGWACALVEPGYRPVRGPLEL